MMKNRNRILYGKRRTSREAPREGGALLSRRITQVATTQAHILGAPKISSEAVYKFLIFRVQNGSVSGARSDPLQPEKSPDFDSACISKYLITGWPSTARTCRALTAADRLFLASRTGVDSVWVERLIQFYQYIV